MKIYFACAIAGGRDHAYVYPQLITHLKNHGEVLTEIFSADDIFDLDNKIDDSEIFKRDMQWLKQAHVMVAETSTSSLGVGYEIAKAESLDKWILSLFKNQDHKKLSAIISGNDYHKLMVRRYNTIEEAYIYINEFFSHLKHEDNK